jgi:hypothetical protein
MERSILYRKGVVFAIIILIISMTIIPSPGKRILKNNTLGNPENSTICGFTTDFETGEPIKNAEILFFIKDNQGNDYDYETYSDENGFYIIENVASGFCHEFGAQANGYHMYWGGGMEIGENETIWFNFTMFPRQPETSKICGFLTFNYTGQPVLNTTVILHWFDIWHHINYRSSRTDENGFYSINLGAGRCCVYVDNETYYVADNKDYYIDDYETLWVNLSLTPRLYVEISNPENGIYLKNNMIIPFYFPLIIGPVDIKINVKVNNGYPMDHLEILIDNDYKQSFEEEPFVYHWDERTPFRFYHEIEVIAHRRYDSDASAKLSVWKFL